MEVTDKVMVQIIDGVTIWVPTNAQRISENEYLILSDSEFNENDPSVLCEFIPGDIVSLEKYTFQDGTNGFVCSKLIKASNRDDKRYFDFLFKSTQGKLELNKSVFEFYKKEIERIKKQHFSGQNFYPSVLMAIEQLEQFAT